jgi:cellulose synthase/poly-beta-1,6-N-acetylglucosamine synthase-like glycosyltransferase
MTIIYWIFFAISIIGILSMTLAFFKILIHFSKKEEAQVSTEGLSLIVPIKGADNTTFDNLKALVDSNIKSPVEYLFAIETEDDPAYKVCKAVQDSAKDKDIKIILTGESQELMGKQHNIKVAVQNASYDIIGSMDADVRINSNTLSTGLKSLKNVDAGIAYFLPYYKGTGTFGGGLLSTYINYFYNIIFSYLHFFAKAPTIIGALWIMPKELFNKCEADGRLVGTVSDDRELGFASAESGYKNIFIPYTVMMPHEKLSLREGINHLGKWFGMVRAEGIAVYILFALMWNPLLYAAVLILTSQCLGSIKYTTYSLILFIVVLTLRVTNVVVLNTSIYKMPVSSNLLMTIAYDLIFFPILFFINLFKTTIEWKGKIYKLGKQGKIISID